MRDQIHSLVDRGEPYLRLGAGAIRIVEKRAGVRIVDDPIGAIMRLRAQMKCAAPQEPDLSNLRENVIIELNSVFGVDEIADFIDIVLAQPSIETKYIGAITADHEVSTTSPNKRVITFVAVEPVFSFISEGDVVSVTPENAVGTGPTPNNVLSIEGGEPITARPTIDGIIAR